MRDKTQEEPTADSRQPEEEEATAGHVFGLLAVRCWLFAVSYPPKKLNLT